ncbi:MAG: 3-hydroxyacyl-ACP dehydratase FabZ [Desulfobacterales bacterium]|nr:3-hydroxyacyl-ACP dehydratase FabZ [Desulfobacterales bacterium]
MESQIKIQDIMKYLPHRYPFLMVDRILELEPEKKVVALKNVTINEPFFQGHFPGEPVMPGVLILEAIAQAGGVLAAQSIAEEELENSVIYFMAIDKARFRQPVVPGDQLIFKIEMIKRRAKTFKMAGKAFVEDKLVTEAEMMAVFGEKS